MLGAFSETGHTDGILPGVLNWLLPRVVGLFLLPLTGGENIYKKVDIQLQSEQRPLA